MLELPGPRFAEAPCCCGAEPVATHPATVPWWQADGLLMHDTREIPPRRSAPWHSVQPPAFPSAMKEFVAEREWPDDPEEESQPETDVPWEVMWFTDPRRTRWWRRWSSRRQAPRRQESPSRNGPGDPGETASSESSLLPFYL